MSRNRWPILAAGLAIALAAFAVYARSLSSPFIFDDSASVTENPSIRRLWPLGPVLTPPPEYTTAGRPLANLSFALNYAAGEFSVRGYHAVNLALHACAALLLFGIMRRTLLSLDRQHGTGPVASGLARHATALAFLTGLVWAVHPLSTGTVSYVSQRTEVMMAVFYLLTLYAFIRGAEGGSRWWWIVSVAACVAGVASKEIAVTAPLLIALYDAAFITGAVFSALRTRRAYYSGLAASWLLLAVLMTGLERRAVGFGLGVSGWTYALAECKAVVSYLQLSLWPQPLVLDRGQVAMAVSAPAVWVLALSLLLVGTFVLWRRDRRAGLFAAAFFMILAPTSSVVPVAAQPMAENRAYLPSACAIGLAVVGLYAALGRKTWVIGAGVGMAFLLHAVERSALFHDKVALWTDTVAKAPRNSRAYENLGEAYWEKGDLAQAQHYLQIALGIDEAYPEAHNNLGVVLQHLGDVAGAKQHFEAALKYRSDYVAAHDHLGNVLMQTGRIDEAQRHFQAALRIRPDYPASLNNLGNTLLFQGKVEDAQRSYLEALRVKPNFVQARLNLGVTLRRQGASRQAKECFEMAARMDPNLPEARLALGVVLLEEGNSLAAQGEFEAVLQLRPNLPEAHYNLANALLRRGNIANAMQHLETALRLKPEYMDARDLLARINSSVPPGSK